MRDASRPGAAGLRALLTWRQGVATGCTGCPNAKPLEASAGLDPTIWLRTCDVLLLVAQTAGQQVGPAIEGAVLRWMT